MMEVERRPSGANAFGTERSGGTGRVWHRTEDGREQRQTEDTVGGVEEVGDVVSGEGFAPFVPFCLVMVSYLTFLARR